MSQTPGKKNKYTCDSCGWSVVTVDRDAGVTPFLIGCGNPDCNGMAQSSMYQVPQHLESQAEWYSPGEEEQARLKMTRSGRSTLQHVLKGGTVLRFLSDGKSCADQIDEENEKAAAEAVTITGALSEVQAQRLRDLGAALFNSLVLEGVTAEVLAGGHEQITLSFNGLHITIHAKANRIDGGWLDFTLKADDVQIEEVEDEERAGTDRVADAGQSADAGGEVHPQ